jgi:hypothetical protein
LILFDARKSGDLTPSHAAGAFRLPDHSASGGQVSPTKSETCGNQGRKDDVVGAARKKGSELNSVLTVKGTIGKRVTSFRGLNTDDSASAFAKADLAPPLIVSAKLPVNLRRKASLVSTP